MQDPANPVQPGAHSAVQSLAKALPAADVLPPSQASQKDSEVAPIETENLPAAQLSHARLSPASLYFPATQSSQSVLTPDDALNLPATQTSHLVLPTVAWNLPATQTLHAVLTPAASWYLPFSQRWQLDIPCSDWYLPAPQDSHTSEPSIAWNFPTGQVEHSIAPEEEVYLPALHIVQLAAPGMLLYDPGLHLVQSPPSGPHHPELHLQSDASVPPGAAVSEFPGQPVHSLSPTMSLYVATGHSEHIPPSGPVNPAMHLQSDASVLPGAAVSEFARQFVQL